MVYASTDNLHNLRATADIVDEPSAGITYLGLCKPGTTSTAAATWSICKVQKEGNITSILWAGGQCSFNYAFDDRENLNYTFKKF